MSRTHITGAQLRAAPPQVSREQRQSEVSVLQCVAVCCSVLPCVAVCCSVLTYKQRPTKETRVASVLQRDVVCCSVLQYVAVRCNVV